ncbi:cell division protein ZipA [Shewanella sp.]|uniref:cell division protein ZipA n=1 Tax=Shewanella sp. TaxID=50422 RepID=UPI004053C868
MEDLQLVLFVLGAIAIIAVLAHGFWSIRKQQPKPIRERTRAQNISEAQRRDSQGFDADGIGAVRVRKPGDKEQAGHHNHTSVPVMTLQKTSQAQTETTAARSLEPVTAERASTVKAMAEPAQFETGKHEPELFSEPVSSSQPLAAQAQATPEVSPQEPEALGEPQDVLVLHVVAQDGQEIQGAELLPCLLSLNFKFGDMNIFHRHSDNAGNGKVLFSLANMMKPGVFEPDNMEQFCTQGIVMFMTLPCYGDAQYNFSIMLNSAEQLADDLGAVVLDEQRKTWTEHNKQDYLRRIKAIV